MPDRYWVGGSGSWTSSSPINWSASSGGPSGASAPTSADNVFFDINSNLGTGGFTVNIFGTVSCNDFTVDSVLDGTLELQFGSNTLNVNGSWASPATNFTTTSTSGTINFTSTTTGKTINTAGIQINIHNINFTGVGGYWTFGSNLIFNTGGLGFLSLTAGTLDTSVNNYSLNTGRFTTNGSTIRSLILRGSSLTFSNGSAWQIFATTNFTFNAGTSTITLSGGNNFVGGGLSYHNLTFTTSSSLAGITIEGANTFNNLFIAIPTNPIFPARCLFNANNVINGTFSVSGADGNRRILLYSDILGTARTLTCANISTLTDVDFRDITIAGVGTVSGTRLGDGGNNTNVTFDPPKTVYWNLAAGGSWGSNAWAATPTGSVSSLNFPLAQDTVIISDTGLNNNVTINVDQAWSLPNIDASGRTLLANFRITTSFGETSIHGNLILSSSISTTSSTSRLFIRNSSVKTFSIPQTINFNVTVDTLTSGGVRLLTNYTATSTLNLVLNRGNIDLNNFALSVGVFQSTNTTIRQIQFGTSGKIVLISPSVEVLSISYDNLTVTGTSNIERAMTSTCTFNTSYSGIGSGAQLLNVNLISGSFTPTFSGVFGVLNFTGFNGTTQSGLVSCRGFILSTGGTFTPTSFSVIDGSCTFNGKNITSLSCSISVTLNDAAISAATVLTSGVLDLNNQTLTTDTFDSSNTNIRSIAFGTTGKIIFSRASAGQVLFLSQATNFTFTGNSDLTLDLSVARTLNFGTAGSSTANRLNVNLTSGASTPTFTGSFRQINFGTTTCDPGLVTINCHAFVLSSGGTFSNTTFNIVGTGNLNFNNRTINSLIINAPGQVATLVSNNSITSLLTLANGTLNLNGLALASGSASTSSGTKNITFNNGELRLTGSGSTVWNNSNPTGFTTTLGTGQGSILMTSILAKTFVGGGSVYNCTLNQNGAGTLTVTGSNTFTNITNSVQPCQITFTASTTTNCTRFTPAGTASNKVTITSSSATRANINVNTQVLYINCTISNINGDGAVHRAPPSLGNTNGGNNLDILFANITSGNGTVVT